MQHRESKPGRNSPNHLQGEAMLSAPLPRSPKASNKTSSRDLDFASSLVREDPIRDTPGKLLGQQVQAVKNSFPLLKIDFEKVQARKEAAKSQTATRKDASPAMKARPGQVLPRGSSVPRKPEGQSEMLEKIRRMEDCLGKFKTSMFKREQLVSALMASTMEMQDSPSGSSSGKHLRLQPHIKDLQREDETDVRPILHKRIQELQQQNNELLAELRVANKKLMDSKFEKDRLVERLHISPTPEPIPMAKTVQQNFFARGHSQSRAEKDPRDLERDCRELRAKVQVLTRELEKTEAAKISRYVQEPRKASRSSGKEEGHESGSERLTYTSGCIHRFLTAMQRLQVGVMKKEHNMDALRKDFESTKAQLIAVSRELRGLEEKHGKPNSSFGKDVVSPYSRSLKVKGDEGRPADPAILKELEMLKQTVAKLQIEKSQTEALMETMKRTNAHKPPGRQPSDPHVAATNNEKLIAEYKKTIAAYEKNEQSLKKALKDQEESARRKDSNEAFARKRSISAAPGITKAKISAAVKRVEKHVLTKIAGLDSRLSSQAEAVVQLREALGTKLIQMEKELYNAYQVTERQKEDSEEKARKMAELEKKLEAVKVVALQQQSVRMGMETLDKENKSLKHTVDKLQTELKDKGKEHVAGIQRLQSLISGKELTIKQGKARIDELTQRLAQKRSLKLETHVEDITVEGRNHPHVQTHNDLLPEFLEAKVTLITAMQSAGRGMLRKLEEGLSHIQRISARTELLQASLESIIASARVSAKKCRELEKGAGAERESHEEVLREALDKIARLEAGAEKQRHSVMVVCNAYAENLGRQGNTDEALEKCNERIRSLALRIQELGDIRAHAQDNIRETLRRLESENGDLARKNATLIAELNLKLRDALDKNGKLQASLLAAREQRQNLTQVCAQFREKAFTTLGIEDKLHECGRRIDIALLKMRELADQKGFLQSEVGRLERETQDLRNQSMALTLVAEKERSLQETVIEFSTKRAAAKTELQTALERVGDLEASAGRRRENVIKACAEFRRFMQNDLQNAATEETLTDHTMRLSTLTSKLQELSSNHSSEKSRFRSEIRHLEIAATDLVAKNTALTTENERILAKQEATKTELCGALNRTTDLEASLMASRQQREDVIKLCTKSGRKEMNSLSRSEERLKQYESAIEGMVMKVRKLADTMAMLKADINRRGLENTSLETKNARLISEGKRSRNAIMGECKELAKRMDMSRQNKTLQECEDRLSGILCGVREVVSRNSKEQMRLQAEVSRLGRENTELKTQRTMIAAEKERILEDTLSKVKAELAEKTREMETLKTECSIKVSELIKQRKDVIHVCEVFGKRSEGSNNRNAEALNGYVDLLSRIGIKLQEFAAKSRWEKESLQTSLLQKTEEAETLRAQLHKSAGEIRTLSSFLTDFGEKLSKLSPILETLSGFDRKIATISELIRKSRKENNDLGMENEKLKLASRKELLRVYETACNFIKESESKTTLTIRQYNDRLAKWASSLRVFRKSTDGLHTEIRRQEKEKESLARLLSEQERQAESDKKAQADLAAQKLKAFKLYVTRCIQVKTARWSLFPAENKIGSCVSSLESLLSQVRTVAGVLGKKYCEQKERTEELGRTARMLSETKEEVERKNREMECVKEELGVQKTQVTRLGLEVQRQAAALGGESEKERLIGNLQGECESLKQAKLASEKVQGACKETTRRICSELGEKIGTVEMKANDGTLARLEGMNKKLRELSLVLGLLRSQRSKIAEDYQRANSDLLEKNASLAHQLQTLQTETKDSHAKQAARISQRKQDLVMEANKACSHSAGIFETLVLAVTAKEDLISKISQKHQTLVPAFGVLKSQNAKLREKAESLSRENDTLREAVSRLQASRNELKVRTSKAVNALENRMEDTLSRMLGRINVLVAVQKGLIQVAKLKGSQFADSLEKSRKQVASFTTQLQVASSTISKLQTELTNSAQSSTETKESLKKSASEAMIRLRLLHSRISANLSWSEDQKSALAFLAEKRIPELARKVAEIQSVMTSDKEKSRENVKLLNEKQGKLLENVSALSLELEARNSEIAVLNQSLIQERESHRSKAKSLASQVSGLKASFADLSRQIAQSRPDVSFVVSVILAKAKEKELRLADAEARKHESEHKEWTAKFEALRQRYESSLRLAMETAMVQGMERLRVSEDGFSKLAVKCEDLSEKARKISQVHKQAGKETFRRFADAIKGFKDLSVRKYSDLVLATSTKLDSCENSLKKIRDYACSQLHRLSEELSTSKAENSTEIDKFRENESRIVELRKQIGILSEGLQSKEDLVKEMSVRVGKLQQAEQKIAALETSNEALKVECSKLATGKKEAEQANTDLTKKILIQQELLSKEEDDENEDAKSATSGIIGITRGIIKKEASISGDESTPQARSVVNAGGVGRHGSNTSINTCPLPLRDATLKGKNVVELENQIAGHVKGLLIQCLEKIPLELMIPLCSMLGLTQDEQKKLYEKRKTAKLDPPAKKKESGGLFSIFGR